MSKAQILVVEDDGIVAMDIKNSLKKLGFSVSAIVSYGEEAIEKVETDKPDLVLMDIMLKGDMNGIEAAGRIRSKFNIPIVYLTAYADEDTLERAKLTMPFGYVLKPFEDRDLKVAIEMALYIAKIDAERKQMQDELVQHRKHLEEMVKERTRHLQTVINSMSNREVRMAELKKVIKELHAQLKEAGMTPVADDSLKVGKSEE